MKNITALILAGGASSRFWPLDHKMLIPFMGMHLLDRHAQMLKDLGISKIVMVISEEIADQIPPRDGIQRIIQKGEGMGHGVLSCAALINDSPLLVVLGSDILDKNAYQKLITNAQSHHNLLIGYKTKNYFPGGYLMFNGNRIAGIHEKPGVGNEPSSFITIGANYFNSGTTLLEFLDKTKTSDPLRAYENGLSRMMREGELFEMVEYEGQWLTLKYPWHALSVMDYYLGQIKQKKIARSAKIHKTATINGPVIIEENVRIMEYAKLVGPLYVGKGTIIGNHTMVRSSMIGERSVIGFASDVVRSYIGRDVWFHSNYIGDSLISDNVSLGSGTVLANLRLDEGNIFSSVKNERINTMRNKLGAIVGAGTRIGIQAQVMPGIKIGVNSVLGPGVILQEDLSDNKRCFIKQPLSFVDNTVSNIRSREEFREKI